MIELQSRQTHKHTASNHKLALYALGLHTDTLETEFIPIQVDPFQVSQYLRPLVDQFAQPTAADDIFLLTRKVFPKVAYPYGQDGRCSGMSRLSTKNE